MIVYSRPLQKFLTLVFVLILGLSLTMSILKPISGVFASNSVLPHAQGVTPFLYPPYPGAVSENSIFDHHMPTYTIQDRTIVTYTGHQAIGTQGDPNCDGIPPDNNNCVKEYNSASLGYLLSYDGHPGIDYGAEYIPIFASADSNQVAFAGWWNPANHRENLGLHVRLHHPNNYETLYGHLSAISVGTCSAPGCASIPHGSIIGISGNTGSSSGPHLHFEIQNPNDFRVDPYGWDLNRTDLPDRDLQDDPAPEANRSTNLWVDYPEISNTQTVLYRGEGNPLTFPLYPDGGILVDDDAYLRDQNGQVPPGSSPDFTADACWTIPNEDPLLDPEVEPFHFAINQYKLRASATTNTQNPCLARWYLPDDQQSGKYAIYIHIPHSTNSLANSVVYRVYSGGAEIARLVINQREIETFLDTATNSQDLTVNRAWIYVGTYYFVQNAANFISISNVTDGPTKDANGNNIPDTIILADAVRFVSTDTRNIDAALIIDSSGSMVSNDPGNKRLQAARSFVTGAAVQDDYIGVVDFDGSVRVATNPPLQKLHENNASVIAAINTINSSGGTNIGLGIQSGCDVLIQSERSGYRKGAILLTDGDGGFSGQDTCFKDRGWPIFTFGFGDANDALLQQIAFNTGGRYERVTNLNSLVCEFIRVRSIIANVEPPDCVPINVPQLASISFPQIVAPGQTQATFSIGWPGSDVVMTLISPSGRVIDRNTIATDVIHENGATYEVYTIANPEAGNWNINLYGANVPATGEETIFGFASVPALITFPTTSILDDFNRANGGIGSNWSGNTSKYSLSSSQLLVTSNNSNSDIYFSSQAFGADQEVYVTFANVHASAAEQDLILKSQSATTWSGGMIEVWYDAPGHRVQVWTWEWPAGWVQHGADIPVTFVNGDTFGACALANGNVEVYKNGALLGVRDVTNWSYYAQGGYIGL